jgi:transcription elongation factor SPT4
MSAYMDEDEMAGGEEVPQQVADLANAVTPTSTKGIRACKRCGLLKTIDQFINEGCENCPFLEMVRYAFVYFVRLFNVFCFVVIRISSARSPINVSALYQGDDPEKCNLCTTAFFEGQVAVMDPRESWAAKWLRVDAYLPGVYAITVTGQFDKDIEDELESRGCRYRCRPIGS